MCVALNRIMTSLKDDKINGENKEAWVYITLQAFEDEITSTASSLPFDNFIFDQLIGQLILHGRHMTCYRRHFVSNMSAYALATSFCYHNIY